MKANPNSLGVCVCDNGYYGDHCETKTVFQKIRDGDPVKIKFLSQDIVNGLPSNYILQPNTDWYVSLAHIVEGEPNSNNPGMAWDVVSTTTTGDSWPYYYLKSNNNTVFACMDQSFSENRDCINPYAWDTRQGWFKIKIVPVGNEKDGKARLINKFGESNTNGSGQCYVSVGHGGWSGGPPGDLHVGCPNDDMSTSTKSLWKLISVP